MITEKFGKGASISYGPSMAEMSYFLEIYCFNLYYDEKLNLWEMVGEDNGELYLRSSPNKEELIENTYNYLFT